MYVYILYIHTYILSVALMPVAGMSVFVPTYLCTYVCTHTVPTACCLPPHQSLKYVSCRVETDRPRGGEVCLLQQLAHHWRGVRELNVFLPAHLTEGTTRTIFRRLHRYTMHPQSTTMHVPVSLSVFHVLCCVVLCCVRMYVCITRPTPPPIPSALLPLCSVYHK